MYWPMISTRRDENSKPQRGFAPKPKVAAFELPWVNDGSDHPQPQRGCGKFSSQPFGVIPRRPRTKAATTSLRLKEKLLEGLGL